MGAVILELAFTGGLDVAIRPLTVTILDLKVERSKVSKSTLSNAPSRLLLLSDVLFYTIQDHRQYSYLQHLVFGFSRVLRVLNHPRERLRITADSKPSPGWIPTRRTGKL